MNPSRLEAFSDGVIAVIITIMVLEIKMPHGADILALQPLVPAFFGYVLSFVIIGIYWNNHHHLLHAAKHIDGRIMWANLHLLFWLSLLPFLTGWLGEYPAAPWPTMLYGVGLLLCAISYTLLQTSIVALHGKDSDLAKALGGDLKGKLSIILYATAIILAFSLPWISYVLYVAVALMWFIPDRRIENQG